MKTLRLFGLIIVAVMLIGMLPAITIPAFAATSGTTGDCTWTLNGTELTISGKISFDDLRSLRTLKRLTKLDLTSVTVYNEFGYQSDCLIDDVFNNLQARHISFYLRL